MLPLTRRVATLSYEPAIKSPLKAGQPFHAASPGAGFHQKCLIFQSIFNPF